MLLKLAPFVCGLHSSLADSDEKVIRISAHRLNQLRVSIRSRNTFSDSESVPFWGPPLRARRQATRCLAAACAEALVEGTPLCLSIPFEPRFLSSKPRPLGPMQLYLDYLFVRLSVCPYVRLPPRLVQFDSRSLVDSTPPSCQTVTRLAEARRRGIGLGLSRPFRLRVECVVKTANCCSRGRLCHDSTSNPKGHLSCPLGQHLATPQSADAQEFSLEIGV
ncbi:unnamed protein product [Protopolystoma xenopodis]|uniref:Uncharacterized protein n=1 Tax=Protopolystoma xenopodis TaxID=117903 RepID=A0A448XRM4_9PLAT|nr:unnamed protein product [Protopolystoma xenopodis]